MMKVNYFSFYPVMHDFGLFKGTIKHIVKKKAEYTCNCVQKYNRYLLSTGEFFHSLQAGIANTFSSFK